MSKNYKHIGTLPLDHPAVVDGKEVKSVEPGKAFTAEFTPEHEDFLKRANVIADDIPAAAARSGKSKD